MSRITQGGTGRSKMSCGTKISGANGKKEMSIFPIQLTTSRIGNLTQLIYTLSYVMAIPTYIPYYLYHKSQGAEGRWEKTV